MLKEPTDTTDTDAGWSSERSAEMYGINNWGAGYFNLSEQGEVQVNVDFGDHQVVVSVMDIVLGMRARGLHMPAVLRIRNLLDNRIKVLNESFAQAIEQGGYQNSYRGVFPIKVNQQCHVIEEIADYGRRYHHGLEAGSKAELIIALSQLRDHDSLIICNGYKDAEFIDLGLYARQMGISCFFVLESLNELPLLIERSRALDVEPLIGVRIKNSVVVDGHWSQDSGDRSIFGLSTDALISIVDELSTCCTACNCCTATWVPRSPISAMCAAAYSTPAGFTPDWCRRAPPWGIWISAAAWRWTTRVPAPTVPTA